MEIKLKSKLQASCFIAYSKIHKDWHLKTIEQFEGK